MANQKVKQGWVNVAQPLQTQLDVEQQNARLKELGGIRAQCMSALAQGREYTVSWLNSIPADKREDYRDTLNTIQQLNKALKAKGGGVRKQGR